MAFKVDISMYDPATDLVAATTDFQQQLEALARAHPKVVAMGAISGGKVRGVFVLTRDDAYSPVGPDRMRTWARIIGNMPTRLLSAFEEELAIVKASRREEERQR